ncbi:unnamed protein product [Caenorhabditis brenneri]
MKILLALLLFVVVGTALVYSLKLTVNGTVFYDKPLWGYRLRALELDHLQEDFLGEVRKEIKSRYVSYFELDLSDPEFDGVFDSHYELGYQLDYHCGGESRSMKFATSRFHMDTRRYHEELFLILATNQSWVLQRCIENECIDYRDEIREQLNKDIINSNLTMQTSL